MKKSIIIPTLLIGALLAGGATLATAKSWGGGPGNCEGRDQAMTAEKHEERMEQRLETMSTILDLSDEQKTQIEALVKSQYEQKSTQRERMHAGQQALRDKLQTNAFDEAEFRALAAQQAQLKTDLMVEHAKIKQQIFAILTPEQQAKADKLLEMRGQKHHGEHAFGF
jgi:protein CpxP